VAPSLNLASTTLGSSLRTDRRARPISCSLCCSLALSDWWYPGCQPSQTYGSPCHPFPRFPLSRSSGTISTNPVWIPDSVASVVICRLRADYKAGRGHHRRACRGSWLAATVAERHHGRGRRRVLPQGQFTCASAQGDMGVGEARRGMGKPSAPPNLVMWCSGWTKSLIELPPPCRPANHCGPPPPLPANPGMEPSSCSPTSYLRVAYLRLEFWARERWMGGQAMASAVGGGKGATTPGIRVEKKYCGCWSWNPRSRLMCTYPFPEINPCRRSTHGWIRWDHGVGCSWPFDQNQTAGTAYRFGRVWI
jgi:hypothetical protein